MEEEFSTLPMWTAEAVDELGTEYAVPAACRGSGTPEALRWLCRAMDLQAGHRLLDSGAGEGGPAELAAREFAVSPVLVDPMQGACRAASHMFRRPTAVAGGGRLPFPDHAFDTAWSIGVLCTVPDKASVLRELRRVVRPAGAVGLLVYVRTVDTLPEQPDGNSFPRRDEVATLLDETRLRLTDEASLADFPEAPPHWRDRADAVDRHIAEEHHDDPRFVAAQEQQEIIARLLDHGLVEGRLLTARAN